MLSENACTENDPSLLLISINVTKKNLKLWTTDFEMVLLLSQMPGLIDNGFRACN